MLLKMGASSANFGVKIPTLFELPTFIRIIRTNRSTPFLGLGNDEDIVVVSCFPFRNFKLLDVLGTQNSHVFIGFGFPWDDRNDIKKQLKHVFFQHFPISMSPLQAR